MTPLGTIPTSIALASLSASFALSIWAAGPAQLSGTPAPRGFAPISSLRAAEIVEVDSLTDNRFLSTVSYAPIADNSLGVQPGVKDAAVAGIRPGATFAIDNADGPGKGLDDPTPATPVGGNPATSLGAQRRNAAQAAADIWSLFISSPVPIHVKVSFADLSCAHDDVLFGNGGPSSVIPNFSGAPLRDTLYPAALASALHGSPLFSEDITITMNKALDSQCDGLKWYYGLDGDHGSKTDLVEIFLHELTHGLGFATTTDRANGEYFQHLPDVFDTLVYDDTMGLFWTQMTPADRAASATNFGNVVFRSDLVRDAAAALLLPELHATITEPFAAAGSYLLAYADFGPRIGPAGFAGDISPTGNINVCLRFPDTTDVSGKIALLQHGSGCSLAVAAENAQHAGAVAAIIVSPSSSTPLEVAAGDDPSVTIPVVEISQADAQRWLSSGIPIHGSVHASGPTLAGTDMMGYVKLFTPPTLKPSSSVIHWDLTVFPDLLMEPDHHPTLHHSVDISAAALYALGWQPPTGKRRAASH